MSDPNLTSIPAPPRRAGSQSRNLLLLSAKEPLHLFTGGGFARGGLARALAIGLGLALQACAQGGPPVAEAPTKPMGKPAALLIQAFNYTDDYINSFTVNGQGGGNKSPSGPHDVGGGGVCCASYRPGTPLPIKVKVRWTSSYCLYKEMTKYGLTPDQRRGIWSEVETWITEAPHPDPQALEVHFFPDGHVEVAITNGQSSVRMKREVNPDRTRPGVVHNYPRCADDQQR